MALTMARTDPFSRTMSWLGVAGNTLMILYMCLVTFIPGLGKNAMAMAMPGGLLILAWNFSFMITLFRKAAGPCNPE